MNTCRILWKVRCDEEAAAAAGRALIWKYKYIFLFFLCPLQLYYTAYIILPLSLWYILKLFACQFIERFLTLRSSSMVFGWLSSRQKR